MNFIGVDVDSKYLVCRIQRGEKRFPIAQFDNNPVGFRKFSKWATKRQVPARVTMEATGVYSLPFALSLHETPSIEVSVMNPKAIKNFIIAQMQRGKTDALDATAILEYNLRMKFKPWQPPREEVLELQHITRRIVQLNTELTRERNRHKAASRLGVIGRVVTNDTAVNMRHLQRRIDTMEQAAIDIVKHDPQLNPRLEQLVSVTGIAMKTGPRLLAELASLPGDMSGPQWVAHAGLDPRPHESGSSTNKPRRVSKAGNRYIRGALFYPALVASQKDKHVKAFYEKLLNKGKKPMQALVAIMRKLLLAIWGMFKSNTNWDGEKFYKIA
ncbi:MAG: IS110 family transposase [Arenicellales bacterium]